MLRSIFLLAYFISIPILNFSQELYFTHYQQSSQEYRTVRYFNGEITSVDVLAGLNFQVLYDSRIYYSGLYEVNTFSFEEPLPKLFYRPEIDNSKNTPDENEYILSFDISPKRTIYYEIGAETHRLDEGICKLYRWYNGKVELLKIPFNMNFINFDVSPDERKIVYQHTIEVEERNIDYLLVYDFDTEELDTIKSDISINVDMNRQFTRWDDDKILFLADGHIFEFDLKEKSIVKVEIPFEEDITDFEKINDKFFFIDGNNLYSWEGNDIKTLYQPDKYDFISCLRKRLGNSLLE